MNTAQSQLMCSTYHRNPDRVREVRLVHQPPGGETVRATVEYLNGAVRVHVIYKSLLADLLGELNPVDS